MQCLHKTLLSKPHLNINLFKQNHKWLIGDPEDFRSLTTMRLFVAFIGALSDLYATVLLLTNSVICTPECTLVGVKLQVIFQQTYNPAEFTVVNNFQCITIYCQCCWNIEFYWPKHSVPWSREIHVVNVTLAGHWIGPTWCIDKSINEAFSVGSFNLWLP